MYDTTYDISMNESVNLQAVDELTLIHNLNNSRIQRVLQIICPIMIMHELKYRNDVYETLLSRQMIRE